jgi:TldD protein
MTDTTSQYTDARGLLYRDGMLDPDGAKRVTAAALRNCDDGELYLQYRATESFGFDDGRLKTADYSTEPASACAAYRAR